MIVDAAEELFVPICIYNNTKGDADEAQLKRFKEPAWNNPVVRIIDPDEKLIVPRIVNDWTLPTLARSMKLALEKQKQAVPKYLQLLVAETSVSPKSISTAVYGMT